MRAIALAIVLSGNTVYYALRPDRLEDPANAAVYVAIAIATLICVIGGW